MQSGFSVQCGSQNPFDRIPVDQTMEDTVNPDTQTAGATKGFGLRGGVLWRSTTSLLNTTAVHDAGQKNGGTRNDPPQPPRPAHA